MNLRINCLVLLLINFCCLVHSASILALFSTLSYADQLVYRGYVELLAQRGHHVIIMTPYPGHFRYPEIERIVELDVHKESSKFFDEFKKLHANVDDHFPNLRKINELAVKVASAQLKSPQMNSLFINPNVKFDLVITEADMPLLYAVAEKYRSPHISITASPGKLNMFESKGNPNNVLLYPDVHTLNFGKLKFYEKIQEFHRNWRFKYEYYSHFLDLCQTAAEKLFNLKRSLLDVEEDIDMLLVSGHPMLEGNRPTVPAVAYVDRLHIKRGLGLSEDLKKFLDNSKKGCLYFSLGAVQESEELSEKIIQTLMDAFGELPYDVLFKIGNTSNIKKPKNVYDAVWFPQQQILEHPNLKAFITHGGQRSLEEAIFYGVPIVGLPILRSRKVPIQQIINHGAGGILDPLHLSIANINKVVNEVASNIKYKEAMLNLRYLTSDTVISGPESAVYHTEYILRHSGAPHLRSHAVGVSLSEYFMLDLLGTIFSILLLAIVISYFVLKFLIKRIRGRFGKAQPKGKFKAL